MTTSLCKIAFIALYWASTISISFAHYCAWGLCNPLEYCCDDNTCCSYQYDMYFTVALALGISAIVLIVGIVLYCNIRRIQMLLPQRFIGITYMIMMPKSNSTKQPTATTAPL